MSTEIYCPSCKCTKPEEEFADNKSRPNGKAGYCKQCMRDRVKDWKKLNPELHRAQQKRAAERRKRTIEFKKAQLQLPLEG